MRIVGHSMTPSVPAGALVLVHETAYDVRDPLCGEVVAVRPARLGRLCVKRIVGLPHEQVRVQDQVWQLGPDEYFLLGDHAQDSVDSRQFGPVSRTELVGRVWWRWPFTVLRHGTSASHMRGIT